jgi:hypothetical protein
MSFLNMKTLGPKAIAILFQLSDTPAKKVTDK